MKVLVNNFAKRQFNTGRWTTVTASEGVNAEVILQELVRDYFHQATDGFRDGVKIVRVPLISNSAIGALIPIVRLTYGDTIQGQFLPRRDGEECYIRQVTDAVGNTATVADFLDIVVYHQDILGDDASSEKADWEIISLNGFSDELGEIPMDPVSMARNQLEKVGGTKTDYPAEKWAESVWFWSRHAWSQPE